ncbi:hypothetical protein F5883DRAFT_474402 [Diaporthe sp. PMI_573]|nr:hypothetical protein F5883DRAFT_474402 [Diaporthaceae sp. PMI_573]
MPSSGLPLEKKYRRLLPSQDQVERRGVGEDGSTSPLGGALPPKRQKRAGRFACDACRSKKSACDGQKPICSPCTRRRAELQQLRQQHDATPQKVSDGGGGEEDLLNRLKTLSEHEAVALLLQVRSGTQTNQVSSGPQPGPNLVTARNIPRPSRASVEFELMHRHTILYPVVAALVPPEIQVSRLRILPYREHEADTTAGCSKLSSRRPSSHRQSPIKRGAQQHRSPDPSDSTESHSQFCDERLEHIKILNWTQIPISNELGARLISFYLTVDHPILGLFDADLFLADLVAHRTEFCCPLLLSAVLCFACQGYSSIDPNTATLSYAFFNEAQRLHSEESTGNPQYQFAIPNIAATQLLSLAATCHGRNELALSYLVEGIELAHQNGLLAVDKKESARNWLDDHVDYVKAASHTAWGTFCRATLLGMNYQTTYIRIPPWLPIPGTDIVRSDGESEPFELPAYMGQSFTELCLLTPLINQMLHEYYDSGDGVASTIRASFSFAQRLYSRLLGWVDDLPVSMARGDDMPHHAATVHIYFHTAVLDLFRPFPHQQLQTPFSLDRFTADNPTPEGVCNASVNQLKHLILIFRSRYSCATSTMLWQNALLYVANACLPLQRGPLPNLDGAWFTACTDALRALAPQFGIVTGIVQGILSMAILKGSIPAVEGRAIMDQLKADAERGGNSFVIDLNEASVNPSAASLDVLARAFDELAMFDEFTTGED